MASLKTRPIAIIAGAGEGTGASIARRFAKSYNVVLLARSQATVNTVLASVQAQGGDGIAIPTDVADIASVANAFKIIKEKYPDAPVVAAIFNVSSFVKKPFLELELADYESGFATSGRGSFLFSKQALPLLLASAAKKPEGYSPTLIFTGATASIKANSGSAAFAPPKWAQRALSQSLAREFSPQGVHVAHAIIDGVIDIPRSKEYFNETAEGKISPDAIAEAYWWLHTQPRTAFTWEIDVRPAVEKW